MRSNMNFILPRIFKKLIFVILSFIFYILHNFLSATRAMADSNGTFLRPVDCYPLWVMLLLWPQITIRRQRCAGRGSTSSSWPVRCDWCTWRGEQRQVRWFSLPPGLQAWCLVLGSTPTTVRSSPSWVSTPRFPQKNHVSKCRLWKNIISDIIYIEVYICYLRSLVNSRYIFAFS